MLSIKKYNKTYLQAWNNFIHLANNGTIFHNRFFLSYHLDRKFLDHSLLFFNKKELMAVFPAVKQIENNKTIIYSHPGASYGGFVIKNKLEFAIIDCIINELTKYCKDNNFQSIFLINTPDIYFNKSDQSLEYLLQWHGYRQKEIYISHVVNLETENLYCLLKKRKKRYLNNAINEMNLFFLESDDFDGFYDLLIINKKKYSTRPTHSLKELKYLKKLLPKSIKLILTKKNNLIIGGTLLFLLNKKISLVFYNIIDEKFRNTQLASFQLFNCMKITKNLGLKIIDFGVSHTPELKNPYAPKKSLIKFKEQFGARGVIRTAYQKEIK